MNHLRLIAGEGRHEQPPTQPIDDISDPLAIVDDVARRYWDRTRKDTAPRYRDLDPEHQAEIRTYVSPFVLDTIDLANHGLDIW